MQNGCRPPEESPSTSHDYSMAIQRMIWHMFGNSPALVRPRKLSRLRCYNRHLQGVLTIMYHRFSVLCSILRATSSRLCHPTSIFDSPSSSICLVGSIACHTESSMHATSSINIVYHSASVLFPPPPITLKSIGSYPGAHKVGGDTYFLAEVCFYCLCVGLCD